jgi:uncharacterized RDD family membrane protein YckC
MVDPYEYADPKNPFEAPKTSRDAELPRPDEEEGRRRLAERGTRLAGAMIDGALYLAAAIPGLVVVGVSAAMSADSLASAGEDGAGLFGSMAGGLGMAVMVLSIFALAIYQWILIATTGQTLAKKWLKMKIVKVDGSPVDFVSGVVLRSWVAQALSAIPLVGSLIGLIDALMIFGEEQRCLHDHIAGTIVIDTSPF